MTATATRRSSKTTKSSTKKTTKVVAPKTVQLFQGTVPATRVWNREMEGFSKKQGNQCRALCWMIYNETNQTVTFANSYSTEETPKANYDPKTYTYAYNPKVHDKKQDEMREIDPMDYPAWIVSAGKRKTRKTK